MGSTLAPVLGEASVQELRDALRGELLQPGDEGYDEARRLWNGAHDTAEPAVIARCTGPADVIAALGFARANDLTVAVRGGGHSVAGFSTSDGGMVIDLGPMKNVRVDPSARRAFVGAGAVWGDVDHESQQFGLATTGGLIYDHGRRRPHARRRHRLAAAPARTLACDNLVGADVVTADGRRPPRRARTDAAGPPVGPARRRRQLRDRARRFELRRSTRSGLRSTPGRCSCRRRPTAICCASTGTGRRPRRTRSRPRSAWRPRHLCR